MGGFSSGNCFNIRDVWIAQSGKVLVFIREVLGSNPGARPYPQCLQVVTGLFLVKG